MMSGCYADKLEQSYSKFDYPLNGSIISKIALFYNMKLELKQSGILYFDIKKIKGRDINMRFNFSRTVSGI